MVVYSNGKIRLITSTENDKRITLVWLASKDIRDGIGAWVPYLGTFENRKMSCEGFLLMNGISIKSIGYRYTLVREESKELDKFILMYNTTGEKVLGSIFNKSINDLKEDIHIYNYIKFLEKRA